MRDSEATTVRFDDEQNYVDGPTAVVYQCSVKWDELQATENEHVRHCTNCSQSVFAVVDRDGFAQAVAAGKCVMVKSKSHGLYLGGPSLVDYCAPQTQLTWDD